MPQVLSFRLKNKLTKVYWTQPLNFLCASYWDKLSEELLFTVSVGEGHTFPDTQNEAETEHEGTVWCHKTLATSHRSVSDLKITHQWCEQRKEHD